MEYTGFFLCEQCNKMSDDYGVLKQFFIGGFPFNSVSSTESFGAGTCIRYGAHFGVRITLGRGKVYDCWNRPGYR